MSAHGALAAARARSRERAGTRAWGWALAGIVALGALARFSTLSAQSFWLDEAVTHQLVSRSLPSMLAALPHSESTPPLYYALLWVWARIFGAGEAGLRSLSALFGTATIAVVALSARRLAGGRAALAAAALAATSPLLIWYSQEARAYSLLTLLVALGILSLTQRRLALWALVSALALATHYFAVFVVVPEAVWVLRRRGRPALAAVGAVAIVGAALLPLAIVQAGGSRAAFITRSSLGSRLVAVPKQFLIGYATPHAAALTAVAAAAAVVLATLVRRDDRGLLALAAIAAGLPALLALAGADYLITRNVLVALVPLLVLGGAAGSRRRLGAVPVAVLCAAGIAAYAGVETTAADQRDNWRGVARALGPPAAEPRAIVADPASALVPLGVYVAHLRALPASGAVRTREVDVVLVHGTPAHPALALPGFTAGLVHSGDFTFLRYVASAPATVTYPQLVGLRLVASAPAVLVAPAAQP